MADSANPEGSDPNAPKRETLRISLPPRPLRPATAKITPAPRPNVTAATTLPMSTSGQLEPAPVTNVPPAWSTAVTKPMPSISKTPPPPPVATPPPPIPPKPSAPPVTGAPSSAKTTPLFPQKPPSQQVPTLGLTPAATPPPPPVPPAAKAVPPTPATNLAAELSSASGRLGAPARVIVANPQAKVFVPKRQG